MTDDLLISTTIKRPDEDGKIEDWDVVIYYECTHYSPGTQHTHPGGHWSRSLGGWLPPDAPEAEFAFLRAAFDGGELGETLTEAETVELREWFEAHQSEALERFLEWRRDDRE